MSDVPCNGCTLCCHRDMIMLHPENGDDPSLYQTVAVIHPFTGKPGLMVAKTADGSQCVYLGATGCTIHGRAPAICREFDCGRMYAMKSRAERRRMVALGVADKAVFEQGRRVQQQRST